MADSVPRALDGFETFILVLAPGIVNCKMFERVYLVNDCMGLDMLVVVRLILWKFELKKYCKKYLEVIGETHVQQWISYGW